MQFPIGSLIREDRRHKVEQIVENVRVSVGTSHSIIKRKKRNYRKTIARWVPREFIVHHKDKRIVPSSKIVSNSETDAFWDRILPYNETWVHHFSTVAKAIKHLVQSY